MSLTQPRSDRGGPRRSRWRYGVPVVCLLAGLLLAATHGVSGGSEIRRSDAPRLVKMVREAQASVDASTAARDRLATEIDSRHGRLAGTALSAMLGRADQLAVTAGRTPVHGPGLTVTLNDAQRDANGRFPRDASPDDLVVHQQDVQGVLNALWSAGAEAIQVQDQRMTATSAPRCVGNTLLLNGRTYSPPYQITAVGDAAAMQAALAQETAVVIFRQYVIRFGLGYREEVRDDVQIVGSDETVRMQYATPTGPVDY